MGQGNVDSQVSTLGFSLMDSMNHAYMKVLFVFKSSHMVVRSVVIRLK